MKEASYDIELAFHTTARSIAFVSDSKLTRTLLNYYVNSELMKLSNGADTLFQEYRSGSFKLYNGSTIHVVDPVGLDYLTVSKVYLANYANSNLTCILN